MLNVVVQHEHGGYCAYVQETGEFLCYGDNYNEVFREALLMLHSIEKK